MDELDARLRAMAKREDWALPAAYESAMDGLEEQIRQGGLAWGCDVCNDICPFNQTPRPTPIAAFYEAPEPVLTAEKLPTLLTRKAFAWRGEGVLLRNLHLLEGQPNSQEEEPK